MTWSLALRLADQADALTMDRFGALDLRVDTKPDLTPVTDADRSVEDALRDVLSQQRPDDSVLGEEFGGTAAFAGRQWVIDPIDGTKNFVRGVPVWATLIALLDDGVPVVGVVECACAATALVGRRGRGRLRVVRQASHLGGCRCRRSPTSSRRACRSPVSRAGPSCGLRDRFIELTDERVAGARLRRLLVLLPGRRGRRRHRRRARGVDCGISRRSTSWCARRAARSPISAGRPGPHGGSAVATNGLLHEAVLNRLNGG